MKFCLITGFLTCVLASAASAAEEGAGGTAAVPVETPSTATPIADVRFFPPPTLGGMARSATGEPVLIRGTVTWLSSSNPHSTPSDADAWQYVVVQDDSAGIWVNVRLARERGVWRGADGDTDDLEAGMQVEVAGLRDLDGFAPLIIPRSIRVISRAIHLPEAVPAERERLFNGCDACVRIEVEGLLQGFRSGGVHGNSHWVLVMESDGKRFLATVPQQAITPDPAHLVDGTLRVRGVAASRFTTRGEFVAPTIHIGRDEDITLVASPPTPPFESPLLPLPGISRFQREPPSIHRVRTRGIVTYAVPGEVFFLQQAAVAVRVETQSPESLQPGELVEVAGFVDRSRVVAGVSQAASMSEALVRRLGAGDPPVPASIQPDEIVALNMTARENGLIARPGDYDGCLISFRARLVEIRRSIAGGLLLLSSGKSTVSAAIPAAGFEELKKLEVGSELQVTGIAQVDLKPELGARPIWLLPAVERIDVLLRTADDVTVLAKPSWWTPRRLAAALATTVGILAAALGWVWLLRRQVTSTSVSLATEMRTRRESAIEFNATIRERNRLAANLHDTLLQTMSAIGMQLQSCELSGREGGIPAANHLGLARRMVDHAVGELRESVWALRSFPLKGQTFPEAVVSLAAHLAEGQEARIMVEIEGVEADVSDFVAGNLLLLVQEAIINAVHHARPASIHVTVAFDPSHDVIDVSVRDDGQGFVPGTQPGPLRGHFGLQGMRERAERLGGTLHIESDPDRGTTIRARAHNMPNDREIEGE